MVQDVEVWTQLDLGSDHRAVIARIVGRDKQAPTICKVGRQQLQSARVPSTGIDQYKAHLEFCVQSCEDVSSQSLNQMITESSQNLYSHESPHVQYPWCADNVVHALAERNQLELL